VLGKIGARHLSSKDPDNIALVVVWKADSTRGPAQRVRITYQQLSELRAHHPDIDGLLEDFDKHLKGLNRLPWSPPPLPECEPAVHSVAFFQALLVMT